MDWYSVRRFFYGLAMGREPPETLSRHDSRLFEGQRSIISSMLLSPWALGRVDTGEWDPEKALREAYRASTYVYACIRRWTAAASSVPWRAMARKDEDTWERVPNSPLEELWENPNPFMSRAELMQIVTGQLLLSGNAVLTKVRVPLMPGERQTVGQGVTVEIWPTLMNRVKPKPDRKKFISHYTYTIPGTAVEEKIEAKDVIHFMFHDPGNLYWGTGPLQAIARAVDTENEASKFQMVSLQNRLVSDGVFSVDHEITREQHTELRRQVREQHQGAENARMPWVLGSGAHWDDMSRSLAEMDFLNSRHWTREEICSGLDVPPVLVGILDRATYGNYETARKMFWEDAIVPFLDGAQDVLGRTLSSEFGEEEIRHDTSGVDALRKDFNTLSETAQRFFQMGFPRNAVNQRLELGFDDTPDGDQGYLPLSLVPAGGDGLEGGGDSVDGAVGAAGADSRGGGRSGGAYSDGDGDRDGEPADRADERSGDEERSGAESEQGRTYLFGLDLQTDEQRTGYWRAVVRSRGAWMQAFAYQIRPLFRADYKRILKVIEEAPLGDIVRQAEDAIAAGVDEWTSAFTKLYFNIIEEFGSDTADALVSELSSRGPEEARAWKFDPTSPAILDFIRTVGGDRISKISLFSKRKIRRLLEEAVGQNVTRVEMSRMLRKQFSDFTTRRAIVIARTEVGAAAGFGQQEAAKQSGVVKTHTWLSSRDDRVRDSHAHMDGQVRKLGERYSNGLPYPGAPEGAPGEVIQCRCVELFGTRSE